MHRFNIAKQILNKSSKEVQEDIHAINLQLRILLNRKAEIMRHEKMINKMIPMSKHKYSRKYLKAVLNTFPQLSTPTDFNTALHLIRGLTVEEICKETKSRETTVRHRRKQVLNKTCFKSQEEFCAYFVLKNQKELHAN